MIGMWTTRQGVDRTSEKKEIAAKNEVFRKKECMTETLRMNENICFECVVLYDMKRVLHNNNKRQREHQKLKINDCTIDKWRWIVNKSVVR